MSSFDVDDVVAPSLCGFDEAKDIPVENQGVFHCYIARASLAKLGVVLLLHGGGFTGLSFALVARHLQTCCLVAPDARGHGLTVCDDPADMSVETLTEDTILLIQALLAEGGPLGCSQDVPMLLVGHSLGGGTAVRVAGSGRLPNVKGVAVIDMVEGTALASLESLPEVMQAIPQEFDTMEDAIEWHVRSRAIRSNASAKVTVPSRMKVAEDGKVTWRTNLLQQQQHWEGWFLGLSEMFLALPQPKLLIVAGMDRLDTPLTMGQIQGKFQLKLVYSAGHSIHEDQPVEVSTALEGFAARFSIVGGVRDKQAELLQAKLALARKHLS